MSHKVHPPWTWDGNAPVKIKDAAGCTVCDLFPSAEEHIVPLICAAPDLVAALAEAESYIAEHALPGDYGVGHDRDHDKYVRLPLLARLREAIAKAKRKA